MIGRFVQPGESLPSPKPVGAAQESSGRYAIGRTMFSEPIVYSVQSGRTWTISWPELIALAVAAGIDQPDQATVDAAQAAIAKASGKAGGTAP